MAVTRVALGTKFDDRIRLGYKKLTDSYIAENYKHLTEIIEDFQLTKSYFVGQEVLSSQLFTASASSLLNFL
jgi:hypothetical protein